MEEITGFINLNDNIPTYIRDQGPACIGEKNSLIFIPKKWNTFTAPSSLSISAQKFEVINRWWSKPGSFFGVKGIWPYTKFHKLHFMKLFSFLWKDLDQAFLLINHEFRMCGLDDFQLNARAKIPLLSYLMMEKRVSEWRKIKTKKERSMQVHLACN